jgi:F-type H+-transporting ATPase subunit b
MTDSARTNATTEVPAKHEGSGFPPFDTSTFTSQWFWLVLTFGFLFVVMWKAAGPRINGVITSRRSAINGDIEAARLARRDAETAGAAYDAALAAAKVRAQKLADETRQQLNNEVAGEKAKAEAAAAKAMAEADARIAATREQAKSTVAKAAGEAAVAIVARLTGETVSEAEAAQAMKG